MDRWYSQFSLYNAIHAVGSNYVCRIRDHSVYQVIEDRPLTQQDKNAGVISDQRVRLGARGNPSDLPDHPVRLVCITCTPHTKRGKGRDSAGHSHTSGPPSDGTLRIVTDLLDPPAEVLAFLYGYRWTIEVFIRFFKNILGNRHLLSTKIEGVRIQIAAGIIACMLMSILTGVRPTKHLQILMGFYLAGLASAAEVQREVEKERLRQEKAAAKKS
jgi:IS4 transposase